MNRRTTAGRCATRPTCRYYQWDFDTRARRSARRRRVARVRRPDAGSAQHLPLERERRSDGRARPGVRPAGHGPGDVVLVHAREQPGRRCVARRASTTTAPNAATHAELSAALPGAADRWRRPARRHDVRLRPDQPGPDEVPAVLRRRDLLRRVHARLPPRDPARRGRPVLKINNLPATAGRSAARRRRPARSSATTRWTSSSTRTGTSTC